MTQANTPKQHEVQLTDWLTEKSIIPSFVEYTPSPEGFSTCAACKVCGTGERMKIIIPASGSETVQAFGFELVTN